MANLSHPRVIIHWLHPPFSTAIIIQVDGQFFLQVMLPPTTGTDLDSTKVFTLLMPAQTLSKTFVADAERAQGYTHVLLIATGSVASVKVPLIVRELLTYDKIKVEVVVTNHSLTFFKPEAIEAQGVRVWTDKDEWTDSYKIGDPLLHIELRRWADVVLIAPCSANTLAKIAQGISDNLVTSLLRALAPTTPTYVFPAMNTSMYEHPLTAEHLRIIRDIVRYNVVGPVGKRLACGDFGVGAMTDWLDIVEIVVDQFHLVRREPHSTGAARILEHSKKVQFGGLDKIGAKSGESVLHGLDRTIRRRRKPVQRFGQKREKLVGAIPGERQRAPQPGITLDPPSYQFT